MLLAIDIGNTNVTLGVFQGGHLKSTWRIAADVHRMADEYGLMLSSILPLKGMSPQDVMEACMCSVVPPLTSVFEEVCHSYFNLTPLVVTPGVKTGVKLLVDNPKEVGADRVADTVAAFRLYGGPAIVVDFGTHAVFDAISLEGAFLGGAIAPGINMAAEALFHTSSQLRRVELVRPKHTIGRDTVTNMQSGLVLGYVSLVEGMVQRFKAELGDDARVIGTGGMASFIARQTQVFDEVNPDLTLIGLQMIYEMNKRTD